MHTATHHTETTSGINRPFFSPVTVQPKLTIGQPNDKYEQEADAMADRVMRMQQNTPAVQAKCAECEQEEQLQPKRKGNFLSLKSIVQRMTAQGKAFQVKPQIQKMDNSEEEMLQTKPLMMKSEGGGGVATSALTSQLNSSKGGGSPLSASTNQFMSSAFGADFSNVRVHTGSNAIQMNQGLNARAFTHGSDVYFNKGEYSPNSSEGKRLLGHELTHVVQQGGVGTRVQRSEDPCNYITRNRREREVHLNLGLRSVRVYQRSGSTFSVADQFDNLINGPATVRLARQNGWCHLYSVKGHQKESSHGLINFVNYCGNFGFHSNYWMRDGSPELIPGAQSAGCSRIIDRNANSTRSDASERFYNLVQDGDCVRIYSRDSWRDPTFSNCHGSDDCTL